MAWPGSFHILARLAVAYGPKPICKSGWPRPADTCRRGKNKLAYMHGRPGHITTDVPGGKWADDLPPHHRIIPCMTSGSPFVLIRQG